MRTLTGMSDIEAVVEIEEEGDEGAGVVVQGGRG
jgi:hypothetical protein